MKRILSMLVLLLTLSSVAHAANVVVSVNGPPGCYTFTLYRNGTVYNVATGANSLGTVNFTWKNVPDGSSYYAGASWNASPANSHTWPPKSNVSGTTHLGCLAFNFGGDPTPWSGPCPPPCWNCPGSQASSCQ